MFQNTLRLVLFFAVFSAHHAFGVESSDCHERLDPKTNDVLSVCTKCAETDSGACVYYEFDYCFIKSPKASESYRVKCEEITCPAKTPKTCHPTQKSSIPFGGIEGEYLACEHKNIAVCEGGQWKLRNLML